MDSGLQNVIFFIRKNIQIFEVYLNTNAMSWVANWHPFSARLKELNTQDRKEIESLTTQLTKEQSSVSELTKLKDSLEEELES